MSRLMAGGSLGEKYSVPPASANRTPLASSGMQRILLCLTNSAKPGPLDRDDGSGSSSPWLFAIRKCEIPPLFAPQSPPFAILI